jgi:putative DNA primase/helicase
MNDHAAINKFLEAMAEQDIVPSQNLNFEGKLERFHVQGDALGSRNGWAILHIDNAPAGQFGCNKRYGDHKFSWSAGISATPMTEAEKKKQREDWARQKAETEKRRAAERDAAAVRAQSVWDASVPATDDHPYLVRKGVKAHGLRVGKWEFINSDTGEVTCLTDQALLVPLCDKTRKVHSLQGIFPGKILGRGDGARDKDYLKFGAKVGMFHAIGKPQMVDGNPVFVICEGYATGASIHEETSHLVLVTFDVTNLLTVAKAIRDSKPDAIIVFAVDNDVWTKKPVENPGVHYATIAAKAVGGLLAIPPFVHADGTQDAAGKWSGPTDFNDLQVRDGAGAIKAIFDDVIANRNLSPEPEPESPMPWEDGPPDYLTEDIPPSSMDDSNSGASSPPVEPPAATGGGPKDPIVPADKDEDDLVKNAHFTILGYDGQTYFLFQHEKKQVLEITKKDLSDVGLIELADLYWWEMNFGNGNGGIDKKAVAQWLFRTANGRGIYDPSRIRGRGAWADKGRAVFHHGSYLTVNGEHTDITAIKSAYVYPMARELPQPSETPLTDAEGDHLVGVADMVRWNMPGSAALMAGFVMLAPICGALTWRPHIWLTGVAGSGKSTVQNKFCAALLRGVGQYYSGDSTEAGIRQDLKADALPVLIDEAESNNERDKQRIENVIGLIRKTSTESQMHTAKGTVSGNSQHFQIRSMFCLASINVNLPTKADIDRLTILSIKKAKEGDVDNWPELEAELNKIDQDETMSSRLLARALKLMPVILDSVKVFRKAAAIHFKDQRYGDQFGTLLAGCWCLMKSYVPQEYEALAMIKGYNWQEHTEDQDQDDSAKALEALLSAKIRLPGNLGDLTVYELIRESTTSFRHGSGVDMDVADQTLRRHGILVESGRLLFGTGVSNLKELIAKMPAITNLRDQLLRVKDADRVGTKSFNGTKSKCVSIPLVPILGEAVKEEDDGKPF